MAPASSSSSANSPPNNCTSTIPKIIKFGYTDVEVLSDAKPPKHNARCTVCTSEKIFINDSISTTLTLQRSQTFVKCVSDFSFKHKSVEVVKAYS